jgi:hypothetical protein
MGRLSEIMCAQIERRMGTPLDRNQPPPPPRQDHPMTPDMKAALEQEGRRSDWKLIETAPMSRPILVGKAVGGVWQQTVFEIADEYWLENFDDEPTHWHELPPPPQGVETHE